MEHFDVPWIRGQFGNADTNVLGSTFLSIRPMLTFKARSFNGSSDLLICGSF